MRRLLLAPCIGVLLLVTGCGDDVEIGDEATIAKAEYIRQGDELCKQFQAVSKPTQAKLDAATDPREQAQLLRPLISESEKTAKAFDELPEPDRDSGLAEDYIDGSEDQTDLIARATDALSRGDRQAARSTLTEVSVQAEENRKIARQFGFKVCGSASS